jgi:hypothetical protein
MNKISKTKEIELLMFYFIINGGIYQNFYFTQRSVLRILADLKHFDSCRKAFHLILSSSHIYELVCFVNKNQTTIQI